MSVVAAALRRHGIRTLLYVDDLLIVCSSFEEASRERQIIGDTLLAGNIEYTFHLQAEHIVVGSYDGLEHAKILVVCLTLDHVPGSLSWEPEARAPGARVRKGIPTFDLRSRIAF
jgi:hypothetical protein